MSDCPRCYASLYACECRPKDRCVSDADKQASFKRVPMTPEQQALFESEKRKLADEFKKLQST